MPPINWSNPPNSSAFTILGYPIANDPIYSSEFVWGKNLGENGEADLDQVMERPDLIGKSRAATSWIYPEGDGEVALDEICPITGLPLYSDPGSNDLIYGCMHTNMKPMISLGLIKQSTRNGH